MSAAPIPRHQLLARQCERLGRDAALDASALDAQLIELPGWRFSDGALEARFGFGNFLETIGFVNAIAWLAHREDHHPDLFVGYDHCTVRWNTHSAGGVTINDFICAAKSDALAERHAAG